MSTSGHLIVLSGEAGAGKDSVADILVSDHGYEKFSLSDEMKVFVGRVFGFSDEQLRGPSHFRNTPDPRWARPCPQCRSTGAYSFEIAFASCEVQCPGCGGMGTINDNSPRRVLQLLGDEWARQMIHPDIWTMSARPRLEVMLASGAKIVINDARFANDRANLSQWLGGKRVDVRTPVSKNDGAAWRRHASEQSRPEDDDVEFILMNDEKWPFPGLRARVDAMLVALHG